MTRGIAGILIAALTLLTVSVSTLFLRTPPVHDPAAVATPAPTPRESLAEQIRRVAGVVEDIRGLEFVDAPEPTVVSPEDLAGRVATQLEGYSAEDADLDERILVLLGAVPPGTDLRSLLVTALSEQVAGFYDPETGELVVGADAEGSRVGRIAELTLAHELQHALADQIHGLPDLGAVDSLGEDAQLARQSLVEGDATATMRTYAEVGFSAVDQLLLAGEAAALAGELSDLTELPHYLQESLVFPYAAGAAFVAALRDEGGWPAVDAAYARPPTSTAQVLFPDRYLAGDAPVAVGPPVPLDAPWSHRRAVGFGAADLLLLLQAPDGDPDRGLVDARTMAATWAGGRADLFVDGQRSALLVTIASRDGALLCRGLERWLAARDTTTVTAILACDDDRVRVSLSTDASAARRLAADGR